MWLVIVIHQSIVIVILAQNLLIRGYLWPKAMVELYFEYPRTIYLILLFANVIKTHVHNVYVPI